MHLKCSAPPEIIFNDGQKTLVSEENEPAGSDCAHSLLPSAPLSAVHELIFLSRNHSTDWLVLFTSLPRQSVAFHLPSHLFIILFPCFNQLSVKLLFIFLLCLVPALHAQSCCLWHLYRETWTRALLSPCQDFSEGLGGEGGGLLREFQALPIACQCCQYRWQSEKWNKSSHSNCVIIIWFAKVLASPACQCAY